MNFCNVIFHSKFKHNIHSYKDLFICQCIEMQNITSPSKLLLLLHISSYTWYTNPKSSDYHHLRIVGLRLEANILKYHNLRIGWLKRTNQEQGKKQSINKNISKRIQTNAGKYTSNTRCYQADHNANY